MQRMHALSDLRAQHLGCSASSLCYLRPPTTVMASGRKIKTFRPQALLGVVRMKELARRAQRRGEENLAGAAKSLSAAARPARGLWAAGAAAYGMQGLFMGKGMGQLARASSRGVLVAAGAAAGIQGVIESMQEGFSGQQAASAGSRQTVEAEAAALAMPIKAELAEMRVALKAATDAAEAKAAAAPVEVEVMNCGAPMEASSRSPQSLASQPSQALQQAEPSQPQMLGQRMALQQLPNAACTGSRTMAAVDAQQGLCASVDVEVSYDPQEVSALVRLVGRSSALTGPTPAAAALDSEYLATASSSPASQLPPVTPAAHDALVPLPAVAAVLPLQQGVGAMLWRHSVEEGPGQAPIFSCELVVRVPLPGKLQGEEGPAGSDAYWTFGRALAGLSAVLLLYSLTSYRSIMNRHRFTKYLPKERSVLRRLEPPTSASKLAPSGPLQPQQPAPRAPGAQIQQLSAIEAKLGAISQRLAGLQQRMETIKAEQQAE